MWDSAAYGGVGQRWQHFAESITVCFFLYVFPCVAQHGCRATCDITSINTGNCFFSPYFLVWVQRRKGEGRGGEEGRRGDFGLETYYCLASRTRNQPGSSVRVRDSMGVRERERMGEGERGRDGCHGYCPRDAGTLVYLLAKERARWALTLS